MTQAVAKLGTDPYAFDSAEFLADPYPTFNGLREEAPVYRHPDGQWSLARYEDLVAAVKKHDIFSNAGGNYLASTRGLGTYGPEVQKRRLSSRDEPSHGALRKLMARQFTPRAISAMEAGVAAIVEGLLQEMRAKEREGTELDFVRDFAYPLAVLSMNLLLGVPDEIRDLFREYTATVDDKVGKYFVELQRLKELQPGNDMSSDLIAAAHAGHAYLKPEEVHYMLAGLWTAGNWTTTLFLSSAARHLTPAIREALTANPELVNGFLEECLRMYPPVIITSKTALSDTTIRDARIMSGDKVLFCYAAANRDPRVFKDPETFDIHRSPNPHVSFTEGIHHCLGAPLARMEGRIAFRRLVRPDLAGMQFDMSRALLRVDGSFCGFRSLPMTLAS